MPKNHGGRAQHGKKYREAGRHFERHERYSPREAIDLVKQLTAEASRRFEETIELSFKLGVDARKADQQIRGTIGLPGGTGKDVRVAVFAAGDQANQARDAGADVVGADDLVEQVEGGDLDFDVAIATPELMSQVGKLGKVLGPRGLMPNPKSGTVTDDVQKAVEEFKSGTVEFRTDRAGNVHIPIGKANFDADRLLENFEAVLDEVTRARPASAKGRYLQSVTISSTMGPGIKVDPTKAAEVVEDEAVVEAALAGDPADAG